MELPTAEKDLGLPHGRVEGHGILVATADFTPFTFNANLGYSRAPEVPLAVEDRLAAMGASRMRCCSRLDYSSALATIGASCGGANLAGVGAIPLR